MKSNKIMLLIGIMTSFMGSSLMSKRPEVGERSLSKNHFEITLKVGEESEKQHLLEEPSKKGLWTLKLQPQVPAGKDIVQVKEEFVPAKVVPDFGEVQPRRDFSFKGLQPGKQKGTLTYTRGGNTLYPVDKLEFEITVTKD